MMKKLVFIGLAVLVVTVVCYDVYVMHNKNYGLTDLVLPNVEALAEYESDMADPLRLKNVIYMPALICFPMNLQKLS